MVAFPSDPASIGRGEIIRPRGYRNPVQVSRKRSLEITRLTVRGRHPSVLSVRCHAGSIQYAGEQSHVGCKGVTARGVLRLLACFACLPTPGNWVVDSFQLSMLHRDF